MNRRRCTAITKLGKPCRAWAVWGCEQQLCDSHGGKSVRASKGAARYTPCECPAYAWPHRPGSGLCMWPHQPFYRCTTPAGTHKQLRLRLSKEQRVYLRAFTEALELWAPVRSREPLSQ